MTETEADQITKAIVDRHYSDEVIRSMDRRQRMEALRKAITAALVEASKVRVIQKERPPFVFDDDVIAELRATEDKAVNPALQESGEEWEDCGFGVCDDCGAGLIDDFPCLKCKADDRRKLGLAVC